MAYMNKKKLEKLRLSLRKLSEKIAKIQNQIRIIKLGRKINE